MQTSTITKRPWQTTLLTGLLTLLCAGAAAAQQMNYQGRLTDANGNAVPDAQYSITFDIYDSATAGTKQWGPQVIPADTVQGRFNVILGPTDATSRSIVDAFNGGTKYLQITFQGNPILPRQQILSSPTAFFAQQAGQLASVFVLNGNVGIGKTNPATALDVVGSATISSNATVLGKVAIGTTNPGALLDIRNNTGPNEHLRLSGSAYDVSGGTSTQGISLFLGLNRDDLVRTDLMIGNSRKLAATDSVVRIIPGAGNVSYIDSVTRTGGSFKDLSLQGTTMMIKSNGNVGIGLGAATPTAMLDVNGVIRSRGLLRSGSETTGQAPSPAGLVIRRVNSTSQTAGAAVAVAGTLTLERDGTTGGWRIRYPANPGNITIIFTGVYQSNSDGGAGYTGVVLKMLNNPATAGTFQLHTDPTASPYNRYLVSFTLNFGNTYNNEGMTQVTLSRYVDSFAGGSVDNYWSGTLTSTYNQ